MKRIFIPLFLGIFFLTLQTTWLTLPFVQWVRPDLLLILTLYLGLSSSFLSGGVWALFLGYLMDLFSGNHFGLYTFTRPLLFYGTQLFKGHFYLEGFHSRFLLVLLFGLAEGLILLMLIKALNPGYLPNLYRSILIPFLPQCLTTALLTPPLFSLLEKGTVRFSLIPGTEKGGKG